MSGAAVTGDGHGSDVGATASGGARTVGASAGSTVDVPGADDLATARNFNGVGADRQGGDVVATGASAATVRLRPLSFFTTTVLPSPAVP